MTELARHQLRFTRCWGRMWPMTLCRGRAAADSTGNAQKTLIRVWANGGTRGRAMAPRLGPGTTLAHAQSFVEARSGVASTCVAPPVAGQDRRGQGEAGQGEAGQGRAGQGGEVVEGGQTHARRWNRPLRSRCTGGRSGKQLPVGERRGLEREKEQGGLARREPFEEWPGKLGGVRKFTALAFSPQPSANYQSRPVATTYWPLGSCVCCLLPWQRPLACCSAQNLPALERALRAIERLKDAIELSQRRAGSTTALSTADRALLAPFLCSEHLAISLQLCRPPPSSGRWAPAGAGLGVVRRASESQAAELALTCGHDRELQPACGFPLCGAPGLPQAPAARLPRQPTL
ncbi:hypothetical protein CC78DRAFT_583426 [Lojkania enalia]|uniref:Uncharacterized protein n=1 Tax=Lojkania enalia TaxID=147567 RepID=A0A9P4K4A9_9PLEO|nr:hypothetical protein CC78DRAFT_583426 [Didymosphaeria enalia]